MKTKDPHTVLGLPKDASAEVIRKRHRKLVLENHPDRNPGNDRALARLKEINDAYAALVGKATEPDNEETAALEYVLKALLNVLNFLSEKDTSPREVNVLGMMVQWLRDQQAEIHRQKVANQDMIRSLQETKNRFQGKAKDTLEQLIGWQLGDFKRHNQLLDETLDRFDRALGLLKDTTFTYTKSRPASSLFTLS